jgi:hypothetical protein
MNPLDPNSFANSHEIAIKHSHIIWKSDFEKKCLVGSVHHYLEVKENCSTLVLDTKGLKLINVQDDSGVQLEVCQGTDFVVFHGRRRFQIWSSFDNSSWRQSKGRESFS